MQRKLTVLMVVLLMVHLIGVVSAEAAKTKIVFSTWGIGETDNVFQERVKLVEQRLPNIEIEFIHMESGYNDKLLTMMTTGTAPDIIRVQEPTYRSFRNAGFLADLTKSIENDAALSRRILKVENEHSRIDGKLYGLTDDWMYITFYYDKNKFAEAGVPAPAINPTTAWTWDEFVMSLKKLTKLDSDGKTIQYGVSPELYRHWELNGWFATFGAPQSYEPALGRYMFDHPDVVNTIRHLVPLITEQKVASLHTSLDGWKRLLDHTTASYVGNVERKESFDVEGLEYGLASLPKGPGQTVASTSMWGSYLTISANTTHPAEAYLVYREMMIEAWALRDSRPSYGFHGFADGGDFVKFVDQVVVPYGRAQADPGFQNAWTILQTDMRKILRGQSTISLLADTNRRMNAEIK